MSHPSWAPSAHRPRTDRASSAMPVRVRGHAGLASVRSRLVHLVCVVAITLSAGATAFVPETRANAQSETRVATTDLNLRARPSTSSAVLTVIPAGQSVSVTGDTQSGFLPVTFRGVSGFAYADFLGSGGGSGSTPGSGSTSGTTGGTNVLVSLNLRADASTDSQILDVMPAGATVQLLGEQRNGFVRVTYNGTQGWASGQFLGSGGSASDPADSDTDGGATTGATGAAQSTTDLNLRSGAGTSFAVIAVIPAGGQVQLAGSRQNNFAQVTYNGTQGWASLDFLTTGGGSGSSPAVPEDTDSGTESGAAGTATVNGSLNLRASASTSAQIIDVMPGGAQVQVLGPRQNGFAQVTYRGSQGWAFEQYLTIGGTAPAPDAGSDPAPSTPPSSGTAPSGPLWATVSLNLRSGPGTTYSVLTVMPAGSSGTSNGQSQNGFWSLNYNGTNGWASSSLLSTDGGSAVDPAPTNPGNSGSYGQDQIIQIIYAAADRYGQPRADMLRVARCESVLDPNAVNASGGSYGLFQFIPSTWATTPYAGDNIFDAYASANAAGWMWQQGRRNEWVCQ